MNILYTHFLEILLEEVKCFIQPITSSMVGFAGQEVWPVGLIFIPFMLENYENSLNKTILADFIIIKAPYPYNMLHGKTMLGKMQALPTIVHDLLKFPSDPDIITIRSIPIRPFDQIRTTKQDRSMVNPIMEGTASIEEKMLVINLEHKDQMVRIGSNLARDLKEGVGRLIQTYVNVFF